VKVKKVISRKRAGEQAQTIVTAVPNKKEETVNKEAEPRKRGRLRKATRVDPPNPHKGSVPDPGKRVCTDPVNEGAILEGGGSAPSGGNWERQLRSGKRRGKV
jgi:hypothetical protein